MQPGSWLSTLGWVSVVMGVATACVIAIDIARHPQPMRIMNVVWPVTGLYFPLVGIPVYRYLGRPSAGGSRDEGPHGRWQSVFLSATHCGSGCVIGDLLGPPLIAAAGLAFFASPLVTEYVIEFALAYLMGIAFQYFPIRSMRKVSPGEALLDAVKADTLSLVAFEIGMFSWMAIAYYEFFDQAPHPGSGAFWFMMQIGMVFGFATTYPANWLLIKWGVKSGM